MFDFIINSILLIVLLGSLSLFLIICLILRVYITQSLSIRYLLNRLKSKANRKEFNGINDEYLLESIKNSI